MNITPLHDRILVKRNLEDEKTSGGIIIPDSAKEKTYRGEIISVGRGKILEDGKIRPMSVKPGDKILFEKYAGTEIKVSGTDHLIIREDEILGTIQ